MEKQKVLQKQKIQVLNNNQYEEFELIDRWYSSLILKIIWKRKENDCFKNMEDLLVILQYKFRLTKLKMGLCWNKTRILPWTSMTKDYKTTSKNRKKNVSHDKYSVNCTEVEINKVVSVRLNLGDNAFQHDSRINK